MSTFKPCYWLFLSDTRRRRRRRRSAVDHGDATVAAKPKARRAVANCRAQQKALGPLLQRGTGVRHRYARVFSSACTRAASVRRGSWPLQTSFSVRLSVVFATRHSFPLFPSFTPGSPNFPHFFSLTLFRSRGRRARSFFFFHFPFYSFPPAVFILALRQCTSRHASAVSRDTFKREQSPHGFALKI